MYRKYETCYINTYFRSVFLCTSCDSGTYIYLDDCRKPLHLGTDLYSNNYMLEHR